MVVNLHYTVTDERVLACIVLCILNDSVRWLPLVRAVAQSLLPVRTGRIRIRFGVEFSIFARRKTG